MQVHVGQVGSPGHASSTFLALRDELPPILVGALALSKVTLDGDPMKEDAVRLLRASELGAAYEDAWAEWETGLDRMLWDATTADGAL